MQRRFPGIRLELFWLIVYTLSLIHISRVVSVEGDDVFYAHSSQLLQTKCAVERLSSRSLVLAALIQEWHNDIDSAGFSTDGCDDTLQILEVVVRRHVVGVAAQRIGQAVVARCV